ncbi:SWIM zinc finger family protein [Mycobacterium sp.]|uniref:SWIM zinc finger family protein n=1 Tax=Mycobacterium sp. TaxID=1785 RepID=UPI003A843DBF
MSSWYPPPSRPRPVDGGIKARSTRGKIAQTWWSQRFIEVLQDIGMGSRLQRGRNYARRGQVLSLEVGPGLVTAEVQGSRARPYRVRIGIGAYDKSQWAQVEDALAGNAWYAASLLAAEMPSDIEDLFQTLGLSLFPASTREMSMDCSCPDFAVPCKHLAAAFYLLAERFDDDPFEILAWRGRDREDLLANLRAARSQGSPAADRGEPAGRPLADCIDSYFERQGDLPPPSPRVMPAVAWLDRVADVPGDTLRVGGRPLAEVLRPVYAALGDSGSGSPGRLS